MGYSKWGEVNPTKKKKKKKKREATTWVKKTVRKGKTYIAVSDPAKRGGHASTNILKKKSGLRTRPDPKQRKKSLITFFQKTVSSQSSQEQKRKMRCTDGGKIDALLRLFGSGQEGGGTKMVSILEREGGRGHHRTAIVLTFVARLEGGETTSTYPST